MDEVASGLGLPRWEPGAAIPRTGALLLVGVSLSSSLELAMLELLATEKGPCRDERPLVAVFDPLDFLPGERLNELIPGIGLVYQTPVVGFWEEGVLKGKAWGAEGRDLFGRVLGLSAAVRVMVERHYQRSGPVTPK